MVPGVPDSVLSHRPQEGDPMDKKAKTPKKPKQNKSKDAAKAK